MILFFAVMLGALPCILPQAFSEDSPLSPSTSVPKQPDSELPKAQAAPKLDPEIQKLIETSPKADELPEDAVVILLKKEDHVIREDGTAGLRIHEVAKILRESGKAMSQVKLSYNKSREELKIETARTIKTDGRIVTVDPALIQDAAILGDIPLFSDFRVRQLLLPDVSVGDSLELQYTIEITNPILKGVHTAYFTYPLGLMTLNSSLTIDVPTAMKANYAVTIPGGKEPNITSKGGRTVYAWTPGPIVLSRGHEPAIPPSFDVDPYIFFSTMPSWDTLSEWYYPLFEEALLQTGDELKNKVDQLTLGIAKDRLAVIKKLFEYVSQEVEYVGITLGESAWKPYPPSYVMTNRYGDCKGKAGLLIAMLRQAGIKAFGVLMKPSDQGRLILNIPSLDFTHMIVAVPEEEGFLFMDPTIPMAPYDYLMPFEENRDVMILDRREAHFDKTPEFPGEKSNKTHARETIRIREDAVSESTVRVEFYGLSAINYRMMIRNTNPAILRDLVEKSIREKYPQSRLEDYSFAGLDNVNEPFRMTMKGAIVGSAQIAGNLLLVEQPTILDDSLAALVTFDQRVYPIFLGIGEVQIWEGSITPPAGFVPKTIPENVSVRHPFGSYERHYTLEGNQLTGFVKITIDQTTIPVADYPQFKSFVEKVSNTEKEKIIFEKIAPAAPAAQAIPAGTATDTAEKT
ncbi:MAG: DUF3857 domain-containing protein [Candidatus Omnitrophica bacterium]|nr:DUF3857 domain-containing protein [Candidatus Omnitrophota bacterium]MDD5671783.1 DUF3857 domain-containing protein [Candidatus Omnitrophota bacterium]